MGSAHDLLRVRLLGPLAARLGEDDLDLGPPRQRAVFGILATRANHVVSRSELIDGVWGADAPSSADNGIHTYIAGLRRVLEPGRGRRSPAQRLASTGVGYVLRLADGTLDAQEFTDTVAEAQRKYRGGDVAGGIAAFDHALGLWRGDAFDEVPGPHAELERARLTELRLTAIEQRAEALLDAGRQQEVVAELGQLIKVHPLRERLCFLLMLALYRAGRQSEALAVFASTSVVLAEELGIDPGPELRQLHQQMLRSDPALLPAAPAAPSPPAQLPHDVRAFTGRDNELHQLSAVAEQAYGPQGDTTIALITGVGGVGKTALAVRFAHEISEQFPDGQLYVNLRGFDVSQSPMQVTGALYYLLHGLGVEIERIPTDVDAQSAMYRSLLTTRRMLVVLDNAASADQVRPLLPGRSPSLVLITSRNRLSGLVATDGATRIMLRTLTRADARSLLAGIVGERRVAEEPQAAERIAELCDHLPLALRIAAERVALRPHVTLAEVVTDLSSAHDRLTLLDTDDDAAVRAVFSCSYLALKPDVARLFRLLGLHAGGQFGPDVIAALAGITRRAAGRLLDILASGHLVEEVGRERFQLHDLLRLYAKELVGAEESGPARLAGVTRMLDWYLHTANAAGNALNPFHEPLRLPNVILACPPLSFDSYQEAFAWCEREIPNVVAAQLQAGEYDLHEYGWQLPVVLWNFFHTTKPIGAWQALNERGLDYALRGKSSTGEAWARHTLGLIAWQVGEYENAIEWFQPALRVRQQQGDRPGEAWSLAGLGLAFAGLGRFDESVRHLRRSLELHAESGDRFGEVGLLIYLSNAYNAGAEHEKAFDCASRALVLCDELQVPLASIYAMTALGQSCYGLGRLTEAAEHLSRAATYSQENGDQKSYADALLLLAKVHRDTDRVEDAWRCASIAVAVYDQRHDVAADEAHAILEQLGRSDSA